MHATPAEGSAEDDFDARRKVLAHRESVVRRLLGAGLSVRLLRLLLPDWRPLIERVAAAAPVSDALSLTDELRV
ncbi:hypothetical protein [Egicoccus sp. AB-alg6-2]|uniref:hypothetical protein n=1 Tax=Egicoccus sp. AB-alg6-2 TaxID=3242692 RepID=UPI00359E8013